MPRSMVGLLAAVCTAASLVVAVLHGPLIFMAVVAAALAAGLLAFANSVKKNASKMTIPKFIVT